MNMVELKIPFKDKMHNFIFSKSIAKMKNSSYFPIHRNALINNTDLEIISIYNSEFRGICNYYGISSNFNGLNYLSYLVEYSCLKTLAAKHKSSISKIKQKFKDSSGKWAIPYETKNTSKYTYFANYADCEKLKDFTDTISNAYLTYGASITTFESRLKVQKCELCGTTDSENYELHHVNKAKNLKGKNLWERAMIAKRRKTLVVCENCHHKIHYQ